MVDKATTDFEEVAEKVEATTEPMPPMDGVPAAAAENPGLSLNDIQGCVSIIDIVTKRGAFEGAEMADVGAVRNRLAAFLESAQAAQAEDKPAEAETTTE